MKWTIMFGHSKSSEIGQIISKDEFCEKLDLYGIQYQEDKSAIFHHPEVIFTASFKQLVHMAETLHLDLSRMSTTLTMGNLV